LLGSLRLSSFELDGETWACARFSGSQSASMGSGLGMLAVVVAVTGPAPRSASSRRVSADRTRDFWRWQDRDVPSSGA
jgi:hypothetical protein